MARVSNTVGSATPTVLQYLSIIHQLIRGSVSLCAGVHLAGKARGDAIRYRRIKRDSRGDIRCVRAVYHLESAGPAEPPRPSRRVLTSAFHYAGCRES